MEVRSQFQPVLYFQNLLRLFFPLRTFRLVLICYLFLCKATKQILEFFTTVLLFENLMIICFNKVIILWKYHLIRSGQRSFTLIPARLRLNMQIM